MLHQRRSQTDMSSPFNQVFNTTMCNAKCQMKVRQVCAFYCVPVGLVSVFILSACTRFHHPSVHKHAASTGRVCVLQPFPICRSAVQQHELKVRGQCGGVGAGGVEISPRPHPVWPPSLLRSDKSALIAARPRENRENKLPTRRTMSEEDKL